MENLSPPVLSKSGDRNFSLSARFFGFQAPMSNGTRICSQLIFSSFCGFFLALLAFALYFSRKEFCSDPFEKSLGGD